MDKKQEKDFFDNEFMERSRRSIGQIYSIVGKRVKFYENILLSNIQDKDVLEYGCGVGSYAFKLANLGARVTGIDISETAIRMATNYAEKNNIPNCSFIEMDAESMDFYDNTFDIICGTGILHHLNLKVALPELIRVLRPNGRAFFMEPLGHNLAINWFRRCTPSLRTPDEHPLKKNDLKKIENSFKDSNFYYFHILSFLSLAFIKTGVFFSVLDVFDKIDKLLMKLVPPAKLLAWYVVIEVSKPRIKSLPS